MNRNTVLNMRTDLPYGRREYRDGTVELFNRSYETITRQGSEQTEQPTEIEYYFNDSNPPWRDKQSLAWCNRVLREWSCR